MTYLDVMAKTTKYAARLIALCGALVVCASAAVAAPRGTLTGAEYKQLSAGMAELNKSVGAKSVNWRKARAACRAVGGATDLLRTQRSSCYASVAALDSLASFPREQRSCSGAIKRGTGTTTTPTTTTGTTTDTTGTTTSPTESPLIKLLVCMSPRYDALARHSKALDTEAIAARKSALARGFAGSCLVALAPTPADLRKAKLFSSSTGRLAADVGLLIKVTEGKAPSSAFNQTKIDNDVRQFENSASAVLDEHGQPKLSVCPHK